MAFNSEVSTRTLASARPTVSADESISATDYSRLCDFLEKNSGIILGPNKEYLVKNRLRSILENTREQSLGELLDALEANGKSALNTRVIDAMTTNETLWFRDAHPFDILKDIIIPEYSKHTQQHPLRIWSAASSTGQEAYSISITVTEFLKHHPGVLPKNVDIIGTDISKTAVQQAKSGCYDEYEIVRGLNEQYQRQYFTHDGVKALITDEVKRRVRFQELNLLQSYSLLGQFDVIFCRNVLIYFSNEVKADILARMARAIKPGGYLFLGGSEPIANYSDAFEMVRCKQGVVYRVK